MGLLAAAVLLAGPAAVIPLGVSANAVAQPCPSLSIPPAGAMVAPAAGLAPDVCLAAGTAAVPDASKPQLSVSTAPVGATVTVKPDNPIAVPPPLVIDGIAPAPPLVIDGTAPAPPVAIAAAPAQPATTTPVVATDHTVTGTYLQNTCTVKCPTHPATTPRDSSPENVTLPETGPPMSPSGSNGANPIAGSGVSGLAMAGLPDTSASANPTSGMVWIALVLALLVAFRLGLAAGMSHRRPADPRVEVT